MDRKTEGRLRLGAPMAVRRLINVVGVVALGSYMAMIAAAALQARAPDQWKCQIDLHQGDTGALEFSLTGGELTGSVAVSRGADSTTTTTTISGAWTGDVIQFTRVLSPSTSIQPFIGVAVRSENGNVRMAGRFAAGFEGIWSASCQSDTNAGPQGGAGLAGPSLSTRIDPFQPTERDRVKFIADASHSSGVQDVTIHVNGQAVQTCTTERCEFIGGPYPAGTIRWRVLARARNGGVNETLDREIPIAPLPAAGSCSISGAATGPRADVAKVFGIALFGPDDDARLRARQPLGSGQFSFPHLPDGRYLLVADTKADVSVRVVPRHHVVTCRGAAVSGINFDFQ